MSNQSTSEGKSQPMVKNYKRENVISWGDFFMATAVLAAKRSKDPVTQVGAVIVSPDNYIISVGYNGLPKNCVDDDFPWYKRSDEKDAKFEKKMFVVHAEANAILNKSRANLNGTSIHTTLFPCNECAKLIVQSGISKVVYLSDKYADKTIYHASRFIFDKAGVECERYVPKKNRFEIDFKQIMDEELNLKKG